MRSGLYNYTSAPELGESLDHDPTRVWTPQELLAIAFKRPTIFAPGKEYDYCNTNYALLGLIAEKLEGAPLAKIFQDRLFGPLGMKHTLLPANTSNTIPEPYSHGYLYGSSSYALVDAPYPADLQAAAKAGTLKPNDDTWQNPSYAFAAGGAISTADDLAIWMRALVGGKLFDADYQRQWLDSLEPQDPSKPLGQKYGYGISQIIFGPNSVYFHGGEMPGYNSFMGYDPVNDVTLIIWTSLTLSLDGQADSQHHHAEDARPDLHGIAASVEASVMSAQQYGAVYSLNLDANLPIDAWTHIYEPVSPRSCETTMIDLSKENDHSQNSSAALFSLQSIRVACRCTSERCSYSGDRGSYEKLRQAVTTREAVVIQQSDPNTKAPTWKLAGTRQKTPNARIVSVPSVRPPR